MKLNGARVYVTPKDIVAGEACDTEACPVARATRRAVMKIRNYSGSKVHVHNTYIGVMRHGKLVRKFDLPRRVRNFIEEFDRNGYAPGVSRFNFRLHG